MVYRSPNDESTERKPVGVFPVKIKPIILIYMFIIMNQ